MHTDLALDAINFNPVNPKQAYKSVINKPVNISSNPYFTTQKLQLTKSIKINLSTIDSFVVYMCVLGDAVIQSGYNSIAIKKGNTIMIPASISEITIQTMSATFLEVYIP